MMRCIYYLEVMEELTIQERLMAIVEASRNPEPEPLERSERAEDRVAIVVGITLDSAVGSRPTRISDLSMGGCFIESITNYRPGEYISFEIRTTGGEQIHFSGEVVYVLSGFGFGLRFMNVGSAQAAFLRNTLKLSET